MLVPLLALGLLAASPSKDVDALTHLLTDYLSTHFKVQQHVTALGRATPKNCSQLLSEQQTSIEQGIARLDEDGAKIRELAGKVSAADRKRAEKRAGQAVMKQYRAAYGRTNAESKATQHFQDVCPDYADKLAELTQRFNDKSDELKEQFAE
jgi:hypothetical protein